MKPTPTPTLYATAINLYGGLLYLRPIKLTYKPDLQSWYDRDGYFSVSAPGLVSRPGQITTFSSPVPSEVRLFIQGASEALKFIHDWSSLPS